MIEYCRNREAYLKMQRDTVNERTENADAYRTIGGLLTRSMQSQGLNCIRIVRSGQPPEYVRLTPERRRSKQIKCVDDILALMANVSREVTDVTHEDLPVAVSRLFSERARQAGTVTPRRIQITGRVGIREQITEHTDVRREVEDLTRQIQDVHTDRKAIRDRMKPIREQMKKSEEAIAQAQPTEEMVVRMQSPSTAPKVLRICHQEYVKRHNIFGIKNVCKLIREAVSNVPRDEHFDTGLSAQIRAIFEREQQRPPETAVKVVVRRGRSE